MLLKSIQRGLKYLGTASLALFLISLPAGYLYTRWENRQIVKAYGGDPASEPYAITFLGKYLEQHLHPGMTREQVHQVIHYYRKLDTYRQTDKDEFEFFFLDSLGIIFIHVAYEDGKYSPGFNLDNDLGSLVPIQMILLLVGAFALIISVLPFDQLAWKK